MAERIQVRLRGIVQGVGFRPFVHNLALRLKLAGWVRNDSSGLIAEVEGSEGAIAGFLEAIDRDHPPLAWIQHREVTPLPLSGATGFHIAPSQAQAGEFALVSPDVATCADCLADIRDPDNRRYGYPFTNCTNCGPRYTIIEDIPYDRPHTTMAGFSMCEACQAEYTDSADRRFHAQPNACPTCGPSLSASLPVTGAGPRIRGAEMTGGSEGHQNPVGQALSPANTPPRTTIPGCPTVGQAQGPGDPPSAQSPDALLVAEAQRRLAAGEILAIKGLGGFHLACDASNAAAVERLRSRKRRSDKPFAVMVRDLSAAAALCAVDDAAAGALSSPRRPIVIVPRCPDSPLPAALAPGNPTLGLMLPYTPLHHLLFQDAPFPALVMTSGNLSEEPIVVSNGDALDRLSGVADWFLLHNRDIYMRADDSVVRLFEGTERVMRRSRGFVPQTIDTGRPLPELLATGGELKNAFCLTKGTHAILSQHIGDLENYETLVFFEETLANLKKLFRVAPRAVAHDLHPGYLSTRYALGLEGVEKIGVQHHHAHIASCMAENGLTGEVIGVAMDGTGYGTDGAIWGGEFLIAGYAGFTRRVHLRYTPLAGGDAAIREPWRSALPYAGAAERLAAHVPAARLRAVQRMIETATNTVPTSSCGRLFDGVAALAGVRYEVNFEGQAAIELEALADPACQEHYDFEISGEDLDFRPMMEQIVREAAPAPLVAARFHNTLARAIHEVCLRLRGETGLERVCLSGGTFQNMRLLAVAARALRASGFELFFHRQVPPNDGGIALGQAVIAAERLR